jgi:hypothetical protein
MSVIKAAASYHQPRPPWARITVRPGKSRATSSMRAGSAYLLVEPGKTLVPQWKTTGKSSASQKA